MPESTENETLKNGGSGSNGKIKDANDVTTGVPTVTTVTKNGSLTSVASDESIGEFIPKPPDGGWGWVIVIASLFCNIIVDGIGYSFGIFLPEFVVAFGESRSKVSLIGSLLCGTYLCAGPIVSGMTNKFGCRPVAIVGGVIATIAFVLATFSPNINILILTYGVLGGFGFGMIYLPSIVSVGYYFERKRAIATGIAVCGSGVGTFIFAPLTKFLLDTFDWKNALLIIAGLVFNACVCGALMRPLDPPKRQHKDPEIPREKNVIDRIKEGAKKKQKGDSGLGSPTRTPRVTITESNFGSGSIAARESEAGDGVSSWSGTSSPVHSKSPEFNRLESPRPSLKDPKRVSTSSADDHHRRETLELPNGVHGHEVQPLIHHGDVLAKIGSRPRLAKEILARSSASHAGGSKPFIGASMRSISSKDYARPMYKKDIFYSGSIQNINEFRSQPDMQSYITSITSIPGDMGVVDQRADTKLHKVCSCLPKPVADILSEMLDVSLLTNVGFMCICLGNVFAMIGFYVPYVYIVDRAMLAGIDKTQASFLLSVIGITNTVGRVISGWMADLQSVNSLLLNNVAMLIAAISIFLTPFCNSYTTLVIAALVFGLTTAAYISLTSIIICDLLGLEKLTNAFGLLTLARGVSSTVGPPIAGAVFASTGNYDASFYLGGGLFLLGTMLHFVLFLPCFKNMETEYIVEQQQEMTSVIPKQEKEKPIRVEL